MSVIVLCYCVIITKNRSRTAETVRPTAWLVGRISVNTTRRECEIALLRFDKYMHSLLVACRLCYINQDLFHSFVRSGALVNVTFSERNFAVQEINTSM